MNAVTPYIRESEVISYLAANPAVVAGALFGSAVTGHLHADSDLDLALLFIAPQVPDALTLFAMHTELEQIVGRDVDLIVLNQASPILAFQVATNGRVIFCRDRASYERFLVRLISEYADFKRIRRPIEDAVLSRRVL